MIKSGGYFLFKGTRYVISAVLSIKGKLYIAAVAHVFHGAGVGSRVHVNGVQGIVKQFLDGFDVALIELPFGCDAEGHHTWQRRCNGRCAAGKRTA